MTALRRRLELWAAMAWAGSLRTPADSPPPLPPNAIVAIWHESLVPCLRIFRNAGLAVLISRSRDGELAARAAQRWGYTVFRGSSSRGGPGGLRALARHLESRLDAGLPARAGMALDGPRGPYHHPGRGTAWLSGRVNIPVVPVVLEAGWHWRLPTWDRAIVPLPGSRIAARCGPVLFPQDAGELAGAMAQAPHTTCEMGEGFPLGPDYS